MFDYTYICVLLDELIFYYISEFMTIFMASPEFQTIIHAFKKIDKNKDGTINSIKN